MDVERKRWILLILLGLIPVLVGCEGCKVARRPAPFTPYNLTAVPFSSCRIDLTWKDNSADEKGFYVYRKGAGDYGRIADLDPNTTSYSDVTWPFLDPDTTYWYKVTAHNDGGESNPSNIAQAKTLPEVELLDFRLEIQPSNSAIIGHVRNNTSRPLRHWFDIRVRGEFYDYNDIMVRSALDYLWDVHPGQTVPFAIYCPEKRISRVEAWVESYDEAWHTRS